MKGKAVALLCIVSIVSLAFSGCVDKGSDVVINAEGYQGIILATENPVAAPFSIPVGYAASSASGSGTGSDSSITGSDILNSSPQDNPNQPVVLPNRPNNPIPEQPAVTVTPPAGNPTEPVVVTTEGDFSPTNGTNPAPVEPTPSVPQPTEPKPTQPQPPVVTTKKNPTPPPVTTTTTAATTTETTPAETTTPSTEDLTPIMGRSTATVGQMRAYILAMNPDVDQKIIDMIPYYISEGNAEGVRGDIAFAQSCLETGYFLFEKTGTGSAVTIDQNNFCGLGVTYTGAKGESFPTPQLGIRAQIQHLKAYACTQPLNQDRIDPRFHYVQRGCAPYVEWLGVNENPRRLGWAGGANYGPIILNIYNQILAF